MLPRPWLFLVQVLRGFELINVATSDSNKAHLALNFFMAPVGPLTKLKSSKWGTAAA
jgi:hypothetical protein